MAKRILVAESDSTIQQVVSYFLSLEGFEVTTAGDGVAALEAVERSLPEAILLATDLPGINGIEVSRLIREKSQFQDIPILFLADEKMSESIPSEHGVISKPIDPTRMMNAIKGHIERSQQPLQGHEPVTEHEFAPEPEREESVSIEELLGWGTPDEGEGKGPELSEVETQATEEVKSHDVTDEAGLQPEPEMKGQEPLLQWEMQRPENQGSEQGIEEDLRSRITDDMIEDIVARVARDVIERVTREVIPGIAEGEIRKEIERLKGENE